MSHPEVNLAARIFSAANQFQDGSCSFTPVTK